MNAALDLSKGKGKKNLIELGPTFGSWVPLFRYVDLKACNFFKKRLQHCCFPVNITNAHFEEHLQTTALRG